MMVPGKDSLESFLNPIQVLKHVFSPLELNFRKVAMKFEHCFNGVYVNGDLNVDANNTNKELVADQLYLERKGGASTDHFMAVNECGIQRKVPMKIFVGTFREKSVNHVHNNADNRVEDHSTNVPEKRLKQRFGRVNGGKEDGNCLYLEVAWSFLVNGFIHGFPAPFSPGRTRIWTSSGDRFSCKSGVRVGMEPRVSSEIKQREFKVKEIRDLSFEYFFSVAFDQLSHFPNFNVGVSEHVCKNIVQKTSPSTPFDQVDYFKTLISILEGKRADVNGFLGNLRFARVGRVPTGLIQMPSLNDVVDEGDSHTVNREDEGGTSLQNLVIGFLSIPLSNVERLKSTLSNVSFKNVSFMELIEFLPQMGRSIKEDHPDKKKLFSVQDFFRYTEAEGKKFFLELDRDGDGQVTLEDLEVAMRMRKLPKRYALEFMRRARKQLFSKSFGWKQFLSLMEQKEPIILRAYTSFCLSKSGMLKKSQILASLKNAGLPANDDNAVSMMRFLNDNTEESVSYGHFRNFMLLLPSDRLQEDPRSIWFEAATVVAVPPPVEIPAGSVLKSALAGGLSCALSTSLLYPVDTIKTRVQASTLRFLEILLKLPRLGVPGFFRGSVPAIIGQFSRLPKKLYNVSLNHGKR